MKTFEEFENALVNGESVYVANGRGLIYDFYAGRKSDVCGLVTACVESSVILEDGDIFKSASIVPSMQAYQVYEKVWLNFIERNN